MLRRFLADQRGNYATIFVLASVPLFGAVGVAVDYSRALNVRSFIQAQADAAALAGVRLGPTGDPSFLINSMHSAILERFGPGQWIDQLQAEGQWQSQTDFRVSAEGAVPVSILAAVPGFPSEVPISVSVTARVAEPTYIYKPPTMTQLDPEASDYNRISVYCYDPKKRENRKTHGRTQMTEIADNAGTKYTYTMPVCDPGQMLSYKLMNVRDARTNPDRWDNRQAERYTYFTDTTLKQGAEVYDLDDRDILETVLCNTISECRPRSQGGILPEGKDRTPQRATKVCTPGKYMYYGWEDRPPGAGWTDRDYDDIRIIIACPTIEEVGDRVVRLIN